MNDTATSDDLQPLPAIITYLAVAIAHNAAGLPAAYVTPYVVKADVRFHLDAQIVSIATQNGKVFKVTVEELDVVPEGGQRIPLIVCVPRERGQNLN